MKQKILIILIVISSLFPTVFAQGFGEAIEFNQNWKFILHDVENGEQIDLNDMHWQKVDLPHDWSVKEQLSPTLASCTGYLPGGIGWYRKQLFVPDVRRGEKVYIYFEGVYNRSEVFVNGELLGKRPNGYISFMYDITAKINYGENNLIAVRADHSQSADSRWYTGSGIYRNVWLVYANPVHIAQWGVYAWPEKLESGYKLNIEVDVENEMGDSSVLIIDNELYCRGNKLVSKTSGKIRIDSYGTGTLKASLDLDDPDLWSLDTPSLYMLKTSVYYNGRLVDKAHTQTGFRSFTFDPEKGFALNGKWLKVKGVCLHHDAGVLGSAVPREVWKRRLLTLKEIGVNAIRTSHNPQVTDLYDLCDELGFLVMNEAYDEWEYPKRKWLEGWNVGTPGFQGSYDFFEEWGERDLADMVKRDRNHISIFSWSIGNEVDYPNDPYSHPVLDGGGETGFTQPIFGGYKEDAPDATRLGNIAKSLVNVVKQFDKSRPVTAGLAGVAMSNQTGYPFALDITGYNYTEMLYDHDHAKYPGRVIFGSENRHDMQAWKEVTSREFIFGQFLWTGIDYLGESGRWPSRGFYSGLIDFGGFIKPRGFFRQSLWSEVPMAYLGTYPAPDRESQTQMKDVWSQLEAQNSRGNYEEKVPSMDAWPIWNYDVGRLIRVVCYTNAKKAKLMLNGELVGESRHYNDKSGIIFWDIPFAPGKLEVVAMNEQDQPVTSNAVQTSQRPYAIRVIQGEVSIKSGGVVQIAIQVVDEAGIPVMLSDDLVTCQILGDASLLGLEASNNSDMTDYTDNKHRVFHGRMIAYIKAGQTLGDVQVRFSSDWLEPATARFTIHD